MSVPHCVCDHCLLRYAAPDMLAALRNVQKLIAEAAMTGFNYKDGDWPERLFLSQQVTSAVIEKATRPPRIPAVRSTWLELSPRTALRPTDKTGRIC